MDAVQIRTAVRELNSGPYDRMAVYVNEIHGRGINGVEQQCFTLRKGEFEFDRNRGMLVYEFTREHLVDTYSYKVERVKCKTFIPFDDVVRIRLETAPEQAGSKR